MLIASLAVLLGLVLLSLSADKLVHYATILARHWHISPLFIGIVIVGFGTSAPELGVAVFSALENRPELALGNAFGSNIANIALILGVALLLAPFQSKAVAIKRDLPVMLAATLLTVLLMANGQLSRVDAPLLLLALMIILGITLHFGKKQRRAALLQAPVETTEDPSEDPGGSGLRTLWLLLVALVVLLISARVLVWGAVAIAETLGISELVIGLTIIAIGTSLPELAAAIAAIRQRQPDLILGNVIGSNIFNMLGVVGLAGIITPLLVPQAMLWRDIPLLLVLTLLMVWFFMRNKPLTRSHGAVLLASFLGYLLLLAWTN